MKIILLLVFVVVLNCQNIFAQSIDHPNKHSQDLRNYPQEQIIGDEDNTAYKLKLGDREVPVNTHDGLNPNERQIDIIKSTIVDDFLVNDDDGSSDQFVPSISMDGAGNFVIVWYDFRNANWDIFFQRYTSAGAALGVNTKVNDDTEGASQEHPKISMDAAGNFTIVWSDYRDSNYDIYYQRYTGTGGALGVNTKVNDDADSVKQWNPTISMDAAGNFVIVWIDERNVHRDIYFQRFTSTGAALGANTLVNDDAGIKDQIAPSILIDVTGNFVIAWHDFRNDDWDIYFQRYTSTGGALGVNTKVNDDAGPAFQMYPSISMDAVGNLVIVWQDFRNINYDIYFQRFTSAGAPLGANIKVNDDAGSMHQKVPSISMDGVGNFVVVWQDNRYGQTNHDIFGQRYYSNGNPNGGNYRVVADGPNLGEISPVVYADNSSIIISWQDNRRSEGWDIYAKIVDWNWSGVTTSIDDENINPKEFSLSQNYPNPFNPSTIIRFSIPYRVIASEAKQSQVEITSVNSFPRNDAVHVSLVVYDILGNKITTLVNEQKAPGTYDVEFNSHSGKARNLTSGVYFYQLKMGDLVKTKKMLLLK